MKSPIRNNAKIKRYLQDLSYSEAKDDVTAETPSIKYLIPFSRRPLMTLL